MVAPASFLPVLAGVGAGDGVSVVAFDPGQCGVAEPVGADLLDGDPWEVCRYGARDRCFVTYSVTPSVDG